MEPVTLDEAKTQLRLEFTDHDEDVYLAGLIATARLYCERVQGRRYMTQALVLNLDAFPGDSSAIEVPCPPLQSVESIEYLDPDGAEQTMDAAEYVVDTGAGPGRPPGRIALASGASWPSTLDQVNAVTISYTAGYGAAAAVPATVKHAIVMLVAHWYENRELVGQVTGPIATTVAALLDVDRVYGEW